MPEDDEGSSLKVFAKMYGVDSANTEARLKSERRAARTPKQRSRVALRTAKLNFRVEPQHKALLKALAKAMDVSATDVVIKALEELARQQNGGRAK